MSEETSKVPAKVRGCEEEGHHVIQIKRDSRWYYACEHCHYVIEAHCIDDQSMILSSS